MITCAFCGKEIDSVSDFCMYCGKSVKRQKGVVVTKSAPMATLTYGITCPWCGKEHDDQPDFCAGCGKSLKVDEKALAEAREIIRRGVEESGKADADLRELKAQFNELEKRVKQPAEDVRRFGLSRMGRGNWDE